MHLFLFLCILISIFLFLKVIFLKRTMREMRAFLDFRKNNDTNSVLTLNSLDKESRAFAHELNQYLETFREEELKYKNGNQDLKKKLTNITHDLRTPLTAMHGYLDLIKKEKLNQNLKEYIRIIEEKTDNLTLLTEQLFDYSKSMDNDLKLQIENVSINRVLEETLLGYYNLFKEKNIEPEIILCKENVVRSLDKIMLIRIFENILSNILKYSEGKVIVKLERRGKITFANQTNALDVSSVEKIFERFYTVENARKNTSLGLSIAKELTLLNHGIIKAFYKKGYLQIVLFF